MNTDLLCICNAIGIYGIYGYPRQHTTSHHLPALYVQNRMPCRFLTVMAYRYLIYKSTTSTVVVRAARPPQPSHDVLLVEITPIARIDRDAVVAEHPLDVAALDGHAGLAHDLGALADPDNEDKLDALALGVVRVLDPHVRVLRLRVVELRRELLQAPAARRRERELVAYRARVREQEPVGRVLVRAHGVVGGKDVLGVDAGHC